MNMKPIIAWTFRFFLSLPLGAFALTGCSMTVYDTFTVSGKVFFCGSPVEGVTLLIDHPRHGTVRATTDSMGRYEFREAWEGTYRVRAEKEGFTFFPDVQSIDIRSEGMIIDDITMIAAWSRITGGTGYEKAFAVRQTSDCGYVACGYTNSSGNGGFDFYVVKYDSLGIVEWEKTFGGGNYDVAYSIEETADGGFILAGGKELSGRLSDVCVIRLNAGGTLLWEKTFGGTEWDVAHSVRQTSDGGYIVAGYTESSGNGLSDFFILKLDGNGNEEWRRTYGGSDYDEAYSVRQTSDGGYVIAGFTEFFENGESDFCILRIDSSGNEIWSKRYGLEAWDEARSLEVLDDDGIIVTGFTKSSLTERSDLWLLRLSPDGTRLWEKRFVRGAGCRGYSVREAFDGGFVAAGSLLSPESGDNDIYILKVDADGNTLWERIYDSDNGGDDEARSVSTTSDGGYIVGGYCWSYAGRDDVWILKLDPAGNREEREGDEK